MKMIACSHSILIQYIYTLSRSLSIWEGLVWNPLKLWAEADQQWEWESSGEEPTGTPPLEMTVYLIVEEKCRLSTKKKQWPSSTAFVYLERFKNIASKN